MYINEEINFKVFEGLKLKKPHRGTVARISVAPSSEYIILMRMLPELSTKF